MRKNMLKYLSLNLTLLLIGGCNNHPESLRWYDATYSWDDDRYSIENQELERVMANLKNDTSKDWQKPLITVYTHATPPKDTSPKTITDLSDSGQAAFIQAIAQLNSNKDDIRASLVKPISPLSNSNITAKKTQNSFARTLVATVTKGLDAQPGDRLMWTWILVKPKNFKFAGYTVLATDTGVLNVERIQNQTIAQIQGQANATFVVPEEPSVGLAASYSRQTTTSADINQQYVKASVDILPNMLRIYRESERNLDVAGNTLINLTVTSNIAPDSNALLASNPILIKNGKILSPNNAAIDISLLERPSHSSLTADVQMVYQLRKITGNAESYIEGEQEVSIERKVTQIEEVEIVPADEAHPPKWNINAVDNCPGNTQSCAIFASYNNITLKMVFNDYDVARDVAKWMTATGAHNIGKNVSLSFGGTPFAEHRYVFEAQMEL